MPAAIIPAIATAVGASIQGATFVSALATPAASLSLSNLERLI